MPSRIASRLRGKSSGYVALFVALAGTSYAAISLEPGSVQSRALARASLAKTRDTGTVSAPHGASRNVEVEFIEDASGFHNVAKKPTMLLAGGAGAQHVTVTHTQSRGWPTTPSAISRLSQGFVKMEQGYEGLTAALKHPTGRQRRQTDRGTRTARHSVRVHSAARQRH
jgi:hypothetical protein